MAGPRMQLLQAKKMSKHVIADLETFCSRIEIERAFAVGEGGAP